MPKIVILNQYRENYGAHAWDGTGECPQYWKNKGGSHWICNQSFDRETAWTIAHIIEHVDKTPWKYKDDYSESYAIGYSVEDDDYAAKLESWQDVQTWDVSECLNNEFAEA